MFWTRMILTTVVAGVATSITDWLFMGVLFHDKYNAHPEVWRSPKGDDKRAIALSILMGFVVCAMFVWVCYRLTWQIYPWVPLKLALSIWAMGALPLIISNSMWMKLHPQIAVAHALGWLAKFAVTALAVSLLWRP